MIPLLAMVLAFTPLFGDVEEKATENRSFTGANLVIVDNVFGSIDVTGYAGNEVKVDVSKRIEAESRERLDAAKKEVKLDMQQSGDTVKLYVDGPFRCDCRDGCSHSHHPGYTVHYDFHLRVPQNARIDLYNVNGGMVTVRGVTGDFDVRNVNGGIEMADAGGSGKAHTVNGPVKVTFTRNPGGPASFETVNGAVDVSFRPGLSADVRMETMNGGMYTDFEVGALPVEKISAEKRNGKFVYGRKNSTGVRIGGGGAEIRMKTLNGDIFIRNREKQ